MKYSIAVGPANMLLKMGAWLNQGFHRMGPLLPICRTPLLVGSSSVSDGTIDPPTFGWMMNLPPEAFSTALQTLSKEM
jgi:hypothetical protein